MMGISRHTAILIQSNGDDIRCEAAGPHPDTEKYGGWISLWRNDRPHIAPLVSSEYTFDTKEEAIAYMQDVVEEIRNVRQDQ